MMSGTNVSAELIAASADRFGSETVVWLTTVNKRNQPQTSAVWFIPHEGELLVFSHDSPRISNIRHNPLVALNFDGNGQGGHISTFEGTASVPIGHPASHELAAYLDKYRDRMARMNYTPEGFSAAYPVAVRISLTRARVF